MERAGRGRAAYMASRRVGPRDALVDRRSTFNAPVTGRTRRRRLLPLLPHRAVWHRCREPLRRTLTSALVSALSVPIPARRGRRRRGKGLRRRTMVLPVSATLARLRRLLHTELLGLQCIEPSPIRVCVEETAPVLGEHRMNALTEYESRMVVAVNFDERAPVRQMPACAPRHL